MRQRVCAVLVGWMVAWGAWAAAVPAPLQDWQAWVLDKHPQVACPLHYAQDSQRSCSWPGRLLLEVQAGGAGFEQAWRLYAPGWVKLPGDARYWPRDVLVNDRLVAVMEQQGSPAVWLPAGDYLVRGTLAWERRPARLPVPADTALLSLRLDGQAMPANLDGAGNVLLGSAQPSGVEADAVTVQVFRRLQDGIPMVWDSELRLAVSGKDREIVLGPLLLPDTEVLQLDAPLPARLEPDGQLRIQVRAGEWTVRLRARAVGQPTQFTRPAGGEGWPGDEVWVFAGDPALRQASVTGAAAIDPSQTQLPEQWRQLPAFLLRAGDGLTLTEQQRGDTAPATTDLLVKRNVWLDFDGQGYTFVDALTGTLTRATRLSMAEGYTLGRAEVNGEPQLVTRLSDGDASGLELRQGHLALTAVSRATGRASTLAASGWQQDVSHVGAALNAPPGWMLLHASGADLVQGSWLAQWNLWGIFLVVVIAAAAFRLWGIGAGVLALAALVLSYQAVDAPVMIWLYLLVGLGVLDAVPAGRLRQCVLVAVRLGFLLLAVLVLQFSVTQLRLALYPQLEMPWVDLRAAAESTAAPAMEEPARMESDGAVATLASTERKARKVLSPLPAAAPANLPTGYDASALIQTGPGEPAWQWRRIGLVWNGPVQASQTVQLYWLSPWWHSLWRVASVVCVLLFAAGLFKAGSGHLRVRWPRASAPGAAALPSVILLCALGMGLLNSPAVQAADFPSAELLTELETRLLKAPDCALACAGIQAVRVHLQDDALQISLRVDAGALVSVPLPVNLARWQPRSVLVDGVVTTALRREQDSLWLALPAGTHQLVMEGPVTVDSLQLPFSLTAHNVTVEAEGWQVTGMVDGRIPSGSLDLRREQPTSASTDQLLPDPAPVFVRVSRRIVLGMEWEVESRVERVAPQEGAIQLDIPLLAGESVLTPGVRVRDGAVAVNLGRDNTQFVWRSRLAQASTITLAAANGPWTEVWTLAVNPLWHVETTGLPPTRQATGTSEPVWRPWPGEQLVATVSRPAALAGATHTVESVEVNATPGARSMDVSLALQLRSSQGSEWRLPLPAGSTLQQVRVDGIEQGVQLQQGVLHVLLHPGMQRVDVEWRQDQGAAWQTLTPALTLGEPSNNIHVSMNVPQGRWLLWAGGPRIGPAVLVWGVVLVIVLVAVGLGRSRLAPVSTVQWVLLGLGMSTVNAAGSIAVVLWFLLTAWRATQSPAMHSRGAFNSMQIGWVLLTVVAASCLLSTIPSSLLSQPDMQVVGNGSSAQMLQWYQDKSTDALPQGVLLSAPMLLYRVIMLLWSLWLVFALLRWCKWGWHAFSANGLWVPAPPKPPKAPRVASRPVGQAVVPPGVEGKAE